MALESAAAQGPIFGPPPVDQQPQIGTNFQPYENGPPPGQPFIDLDAMPPACEPCDYWTYQTLPDGIIYKSYLAGVKEPRMGAVFLHEQNDGWLWDSTLGGRFGLMRYGTQDRIRPQGWQLDVEGSAQLRLDLVETMDFRAVDFKAGPWLTYGIGPHAFKFGYYHLSSHTGDEFLLKRPGYPRLNFARDVLMVGYSRYLYDDFRIYAEAGWAFYTDVSEPLEFQFGFEWAPSYATGPRGAPFFAVNGHLREELDFGGSITAQAGWAWRGDNNGHLMRLGLHYLNGGSNHYSFFNDFEQQFGAGLWYDY